MQRPASSLTARLLAPVSADPKGFGAGFVALFYAGIAGLTAGLILAVATGTLEELPGLLVLVPAASAMRGCIFGALGSRLGTAIHTGTFQVRFGPDSLVGQNANASILLSFSLSAVLAVYASVVAAVFGVSDVISLADFIVVSVAGGLIASFLVLAIAIGVAALSARRGWDLDNVVSPVVTSSGDVIALPALLLATLLVDIEIVTVVVAVMLAVGAVAAAVVGWRSRRELTRRIVHESLAVLLLAGAVSTVAGAAIEQQAEAFLVLPVFLVLMPPFLGLSGSLGAILAARLATKLHLGLMGPGREGLRAAAGDVGLVLIYAVPVFLFLGLAGDLIALVFSVDSPGQVDVILAMVIAGSLTTAVVVLVAYGAATAAHRFGVDPDNFGIPMVTSVLDMGGAFSLVLALVLLGLT